MAGIIVPVAKPLCLCDGAAVTTAGKVDVHGILNAIRAPSFPCVHPMLTAFAQLYQGLGDVWTWIDIQLMTDGRLIHTSSPIMVSFQSRTQTRYVVLSMPNIRFEQPGMYLSELVCDSTVTADVSFRVR